jgi:hypothetical protein
MWKDQLVMEKGRPVMDVNPISFAIDNLLLIRRNFQHDIVKWDELASLSSLWELEPMLFNPLHHLQLDGRSLTSLVIMMEL